MSSEGRAKGLGVRLRTPTNMFYPQRSPQPQVAAETDIVFSTYNQYVARQQDIRRQDANAYNFYSGQTQQIHQGSMQPTQESQMMYPQDFIVNEEKSNNRFFVPQQFPADSLIANTMLNYGSAAADQYKNYVVTKINEHHYLDNLKFLFKVDNQYVTKKLLILFFPYLPRNWAPKTVNNSVAPPKEDLNSADLYIPLLSFISFVLISGIRLGMSNRFSPEVLGMLCTKALMWLLIEQLVLNAWMYLFNLTVSINSLSLIAFCGYKYLTALICVAGSIFFGSNGYNLMLLYMSTALSYFLARTLRLYILPESATVSNPFGNKTRMYLLLFIIFSQPIFIWLLTRGIA